LAIGTYFKDDIVKVRLCINNKFINTVIHKGFNSYQFMTFS